MSLATCQHSESDSEGLCQTIASDLDAPGAAKITEISHSCKLPELYRDKP